MICHIAFDKPALTRKERVNNVKKRNYFEKYSTEAREVLDAILDKYAEEGIDSIEDINILKVRPFRSMGSPLEIIRKFGSKEKYLEAVKEVEERIYEVV
jgi:type I restriction enzyme R subunit